MWVARVRRGRGSGRRGDRRFVPRTVVGNALYFLVNLGDGRQLSGARRRRRPNRPPPPPPPTSPPRASMTCLAPGATGVHLCRRGLCLVCQERYRLSGALQTYWTTDKDGHYVTNIRGSRRRAPAKLRFP